MINDGQVVAIEYTLKSDSGEILDATTGRAPLTFICGKKNILPQIEKAISDKAAKIDEEFQIRLSPEQAYGHFDKSLVQSMDRDQCDESQRLWKTGMQFEMQDPRGKDLVATIIEIQEKKVVVDANHALAGEALNFDIKIVSVKQASHQELSQGYIASESSCCESDGGCCD